MANPLDHLLYAGADLDQMMAGFETLCGIKPGMGGVHPGLGTRNALASLGPDCYFEMIAPDSEQNVPGSWGELFKTYTHPRIFSYMIRATDLESMAAVLTSAGIESDLFEASRTTPAGAVLKWRLLIPRDNPLGNYVPKFIDWTDTTHPGLTSAKGSSLIDFEIGHPEAARLRKLLGELDVAVAVSLADRPCMRARIKTPAGLVVMNSAH